jgi:Ca2+-binding EF-hand superfamily protein
MWIFGWASSNLSSAMERFNSEVAQRLFKKWQDAKNFVLSRKVAIDDNKDMLKAAFDTMDQSGDGEIDVKELSGLAKSLGVEFDEDDLSHVLDAIDDDRSGTIGFDEFQKMMSHLSSTNGTVDVKDIISAFKSLVRLEAPMLIFVSGMFLIFSSLVIYWVEQPPISIYRGVDVGQDWRYFDVLWFMVISTTTIGLGDMSPDWNRPWAASFEVALTAVGVVLIALAISLLVQLFSEKLENINAKVNRPEDKTKISPQPQPSPSVPAKQNTSPTVQHISYPSTVTVDALEVLDLDL